MTLAEKDGYLYVPPSSMSRVDRKLTRLCLSKPASGLVVAVKEFRVRRDGLDEAKNMRLLKESLTENKNISLHEAIIMQGRGEEPKVFIVFLKAPHGDLWQFLHGGETIGHRGEIIRSYDFSQRFPQAADIEIELAPSLLKQCEGLAGALRFLHEGFQANDIDLFCAHMDLKPNNVVIFDGGPDGEIVGMWKLCDFGISAFKEHPKTHQDSSVISVGDYHAQVTMKTKPRRDRGPYQAPEVWRFRDTSDISPQAASDQGRVGRKSDIWSFGSIFTEVLTFSLQRDAGVKRFAKYRLSGRYQKDDYFYSSISPDALYDPSQQPLHSYQVKPQVLDWLNELCMHSSTTQRWAECWALCIRRILEVDPNKRPDAQTLVSYVRHVRAHVLHSHQPKEIRCVFQSSAHDSIRVPAPVPPIPALVREPALQDLRPGEEGPTIIIRQPTLPLAVNNESGEIESAYSDPDEKSQSVERDKGSQPGGRGDEQEGSIVVLDSEPLPLSEQENFILGQPLTAHGIMTSRDDPREVKPSTIQKLKIGSRREAIAVTSDGLRAAFLTKPAIHIFTVFNQSGLPNPELEAVLPFTKDERGPVWVGIAIAGAFLVVWGFEKKSKDSQLRVMRRTDDGQWENLAVPNENDVRRFDYDKRVAVSSQGYVAVITSGKITVVAYQSARASRLHSRGTGNRRF
ncbi:kinase-like domain-containing protein [Pseudomassariella vexata]|uniref:non-specific serine/threonine protein kinase n=1 Tax=Pseudomassariella vexata TaxID=1141098 RepID=A0A1Y2DN03_9PEZI|nr:kinase-like domain-containing protein [Pseudomassariella vexata]ORY60025.1 kinase-like domain-containing protein [Pseudomassariella vexata]